MRPIRFATTAMLLAAAQVIAGPLYSIGPVRPDLLCPLAVFTALHAPPGTAILAAAMLGAARDVASIDPFGTGIVSYALAAVAVLIGRRTLDPDHPASGAILMAFGSALGAIGLVFGPPLRVLEWIPHPGWIIAGSVAYTAAAGLALLCLLDSWKGWLGLGDGEMAR
ncbi:MAG: rod shape-determining protein MreD [Planctomycetes bacterium]|nr:rod shape-determining protein MreD [Planctomycetota bacterium]